jgi:hypothetical protein
MNHTVYIYIDWCSLCGQRTKEVYRGQNDFLSLQLLIMSGIAGETFKSIIRTGRLVLIKRQTTWPSFRFELVSGRMVIAPRKGLLRRSVVFWLNTVQDEAGTREKTNSAGLIYELQLSTLYSTWQFSLLNECTLKSEI